MTEMKESVFLSIGSNLGDAEANCYTAIEELSKEVGLVTILNSSSFYNSKPWGKTDQPDFVNCVVEVVTTLTPVELLSLLKDIEARMGRVPAGKWEARAIDIDILLYGSKVLSEQALTVPHPLMEQRGFVLMPLCEIAPALIHPVSGKSMEELAREVGAGGVEMIKPRQ